MIQVNKSRGRAGFTLIELLVVIAIIAILAALTVAGVMMFLRKGPEVDNRNTQSQMEAAATSFKARWGMYFPSKIYLCNFNDPKAGTGYSGNSGPIPGAFRKQSLAFLTRRWPRLTIPIVNTPATFDWSGGKPGFTEVVLEGDQCLVFFLGGIPDPNTGGCQGFSTDPSNPTKAGGDRISDFDFKVGRLFDRSGAGFYSYRDSHGVQPYAYFWSGNRQNSYVETDCQTLIIPPAVGSVGGPPGPYYDQAPWAGAPPNPNPKKYYNPNTFQIISAGFDQKFGFTIISAGPPIVYGGTLWNKNNPMAPDPVLIGRGDGADDITNFHDRTLNAP